MYITDNDNNLSHIMDLLKQLITLKCPAKTTITKIYPLIVKGKIIKKEYARMNTDSNIEDFGSHYNEIEIKEALAEFFEKLTEKEAEVLKLRFGLADGKTRSLEEVAQILGVSRERVRQIEHKAIHRPVHLKRRKKIADYYK